MKSGALLKTSIAGAVLTASTEGAVIYSGPINLTLTFQNGDELYVDFEGMNAAIQASPIAGDDIFIADYSSDDFTVETPESSVARTGSNLLEFSAGQSIGFGSNFGAYGDLRDGSTFDTSLGQYGGIRLDTGNYGWAQLSFDSVNNTVTLVDFAYEDTGSAIAAGAVPEPSTLAALLLAGSTLAFRRRRPLS